LVSNLKDTVERYIAFQSRSPSPFHTVETVRKIFLGAGFTALDPKEVWDVKKGGSYFLVHPGGKSIIGFKVGEELPGKAGFSILGAHTDSPALRLRLHPWDQQDGYGRLLVQKHGSLILRSWLDRPLILAGALYRALPDLSISTEIVETHLPVGGIPDLAIHLDREKNGEIHPELALPAIFGTKLGGTFQDLKNSLSQLLDTPSLTESHGFEIYLAPYWPHALVGADQSLIMGPRHDDLAMVFSGLMGFMDRTAQPRAKTSVVAFFDGEETGSQVSGGAKSHFFRDALGRLTLSLDDSMPHHLERALASSFFISADMAHALHPSYPQKHDSVHRPKINEGLVLKDNANDSYATSGWSGAYFRKICENASVPLQLFVPRQDMVCGSTIGPIMAAQLGCPVVDVGAPMWGMHSACETMGTLDLVYGIRAFSEFFCPSK
jgi:aspartyl aminopeptidase